MEFEWDETKSRKNAEERGLPFDVAIDLFAGPTLEEPDLRRDYGEPRTIAVGTVAGRTLTCVYTDRGKVRRVISLRQASRKERDAHHQAYPPKS
jgi:uncharacterized DUF497 family protein